MMDILTSLVHTVDIHRVSDTGLKRTFTAVQQLVPCRITEPSESMGDVYGGSKATARGTAHFLPNASIRSEDLLIYGTRRLQVAGVREIPGEFGMGVHHQVVEWTETGGV